MLNVRILKTGSEAISQQELEVFVRSIVMPTTLKEAFFSCKRARTKKCLDPLITANIVLVIYCTNKPTSGEGTAGSLDKEAEKSATRAYQLFTTLSMLFHTNSHLRTLIRTSRRH